MMNRRLFLGTTLVGLAPLIGCGGGPSLNRRQNPLLPGVLPVGLTPSGKYLFGGRIGSEGHGEAIIAQPGQPVEQALNLNPPNALLGSSVMALSDDGRVAGLYVHSNPTDSRRATLWQEGRWIDLHPDGYMLSDVHWVRGDGAVQRGGVWRDRNSNYQFVEWRGSVKSMTFLPETYISLRGSADGHRFTVTARDPVTSQYQAMLYVDRVQIPLHPKEESSVVEGISPNGRFQVGTAQGFSALSRRRATIWNGEAGSIRDLHPEGWFNSEATHVTSDGRWILGHGYPEGGRTAQTILWAEGGDRRIDLQQRVQEQLPTVQSYSPAGLDEQGNILLYVHSEDVPGSLYLPRWLDS
jgi:hypothetical protein